MANPELWRKIFQQAFSRMTKDSILIVTSYNNEEHTELIKLIGQLNGKVAVDDLQDGFPIPGTLASAYDKHLTIINKG